MKSRENLKGIQRECRGDLEEIQTEFSRNLEAIARVLKKQKKNKYNKS